MTLILKDVLDIDKVSFKDMDEFKKIIEANVEFYEDKPSKATNRNRLSSITSEGGTDDMDIASKDDYI